MFGEELVVLLPEVFDSLFLDDVVHGLREGLVVRDALA